MASYRQPNKIMAYLTFHKCLVWFVAFNIQCYKPKPVTCEKLDTPLFYEADDMLQLTATSVVTSHKSNVCSVCAVQVWLQIAHFCVGPRLIN